MKLCFSGRKKIFKFYTVATKLTFLFKLKIEGGETKVFFLTRQFRQEKPVQQTPNALLKYATIEWANIDAQIDGSCPYGSFPLRWESEHTTGIPTTRRRSSVPVSVAVSLVPVPVATVDSPPSDIDSTSSLSELSGLLLISETTRPMLSIKERMPCVTCAMRSTVSCSPFGNTVCIIHVGSMSCSRDWLTTWWKFDFTCLSIDKCSDGAGLLEFFRCDRYSDLIAEKPGAVVIMPSPTSNYEITEKHISYSNFTTEKCNSVALSRLYYMFCHREVFWQCWNTWVW